MGRITNEETVTVPREKYEELIKQLGIATGMLRGLGFYLEEKNDGGGVLIGRKRTERIVNDCRDVAQNAEQAVDDLILGDEK